MGTNASGSFIMLKSVIVVKTLEAVRSPPVDQYTTSTTTFWMSGMPKSTMPKTPWQIATLTKTASSRARMRVMRPMKESSQP